MHARPDVLHAHRTTLALRYMPRMLTLPRMGWGLWIRPLCAVRTLCLTKHGLHGILHRSTLSSAS